MRFDIARLFGSIRSVVVVVVALIAFIVVVVVLWVHIAVVIVVVIVVICIDIHKIISWEHDCCKDNKSV